MSSPTWRIVEAIAKTTSGFRRGECTTRKVCFPDRVGLISDKEMYFEARRSYRFRRYCLDCDGYCNSLRHPDAADPSAGQGRDDLHMGGKRRLKMTKQYFCVYFLLSVPDCCESCLTSG